MKFLAKYLLRKIGLRITRFHESRARHLMLIESLGIDLVLDVGANVGQFATSVLEDGYRGNIVSFEPTARAYETLKKKTNGFDNWTVHSRAAVGEKNSQVEMNIAGNDALSSSILTMGVLHKQSAPESSFIGVENVDLVTVDSVFSEYFSDRSECLLKIDVQGYEQQVIEGAVESLKSIRAVKIECSLVSLYEGDKTFEHYFQFFKDNGFQLADIEPGFADPCSGRLLQFDAFFVKP